MVSFTEAENSMDERFVGRLGSEIMLGRKMDSVVYKGEGEVFVKRD
jgi:hypothetical protein